MQIYVWGTGCGASELMDAGLAVERVIAFADSFPTGDTFLGRPVILPEQIPTDCDLVIVTTRQTEAVAQRAEMLGVPAEKILFMKNHHQLTDRNRNYKWAEAVLGKELLEKIVFPARMVRQPAYLKTKLSGPMLENDYIRLATLELLCGRLEQVSGACAELGVYRGAFAQCINTLLPERILYLFDSFEGFVPEEAACASEAFAAVHRDTNAEQVLASMPHPETVRARIGYFPGTAVGLEEQFCLVSLDADLEESTLAGLRYFWPRMEAGGYILLHDYHSDLAGVVRAVERYESELGERLPAVPVCDIGGSLILCK